MNCPNCQQPATIEHLRNNPECSRVAQSFAALYRASKRTTPPKAGPGRPVAEGTIYFIEALTDAGWEITPAHSRKQAIDKAQQLAQSSGIRHFVYQTVNGIRKCSFKASPKPTSKLPA